MKVQARTVSPTLGRNNDQPLNPDKMLEFIQLQRRSQRAVIAALKVGDIAEAVKCQANVYAAEVFIAQKRAERFLITVKRDQQELNSFLDRQSPSV